MQLLFSKQEKQNAKLSAITVCLAEGCFVCLWT